MDSASDDGPVTVVVRRPVRAIALTAGLSHVCAVLEDHTLKCWGDGGSGQLGYGDMRLRGVSAAEMGDALPTVDVGTGRTVREVSGGRYNTCALLDDGSLKCWGNGGLVGQAHSYGSGPGQMGDNLPPPSVPAGRQIARFSAGISFAMAALDDGSVVTWIDDVSTVRSGADDPPRARQDLHHRDGSLHQADPVRGRHDRRG